MTHGGIPQIYWVYSDSPGDLNKTDSAYAGYGLRFYISYKTPVTSVLLGQG